MRFSYHKQDDGSNEVLIFDRASGAGIIEIEPNHDWFWIDEKVDQNWSEEEYVLKIAKVITDSLNKSDIPKPNIKKE